MRRKGPAEAGRQVRVRVLALSPVPYEGAGCRFRIAQYVPSLEAAGIDVTISPFFTTEFFRLVYRPGNSLEKTRLFILRAIGSRAAKREELAR